MMLHCLQFTKNFFAEQSAKAMTAATGGEGVFSACYLRCLEIILFLPLMM